MAGLGATAILNRTGKLLAVISGDISSGASTGTSLQIRYGTGTPPVNGAAASVGTAVGATRTIASGTTNFSMNAKIDAAGNPGDTAWFDLAMGAGTGTLTIINPSVSVIEA